MPRHCRDAAAPCGTPTEATDVTEFCRPAEQKPPPGANAVNQGGARWLAGVAVPGAAGRRGPVPPAATAHGRAAAAPAAAPPRQPPPQAPATAARGPAATAHGPAATAHGPAATAHGPAATAHGPAATAHGPAATGARPGSHCARPGSHWRTARQPRRGGAGRGGSLPKSCAPRTGNDINVTTMPSERHRCDIDAAPSGGVAHEAGIPTRLARRRARTAMASRLRC
jgi:hypothetical protein